MSKCYICSGDKFVDDHHYDCREGKLSPDTVPLCRRCHRTYHNWGVEWFDDEYLDKAIEIENRKRELWGDTPMHREDVRRSDYWYKKHGIPTPALRGTGEPKVVYDLREARAREKLAKWIEWATQ